MKAKTRATPAVAEGRAVTGDTQDAATTMRELSAVNPTPIRAAAYQQDHPAPAPKRGAMVWRTNTAMHTTHTEWDPNAEPVPPTPAQLSSELMGTCVALVKKIGIPVAALKDITPEQLVRLKHARTVANHAPADSDRFAEMKLVLEELRS